MMGRATIIVTVILMDVCVCILASTALPAVALTIEDKDCDDCKYLYRI